MFLSSFIGDMQNDVITCILFGKTSSKISRLSLLNNLLFFLDLVEEKKEQGIADWNDRYQIDEMKSMLRCMMDPLSIDKLFNIYNSNSPGGIGHMAITTGSPIFTIS